MFWLIGSPAFVVLHTGHSVTLVEYLFRVFVSLLAFGGIGVTIFWGVRTIGAVHSKVSRRGEINENEP